MTAQTEFLQIEGDHVSLVRREIIRQIPLAELWPHLAIPPDHTTPRLPRGTAMFHHRPVDRTILVVVEVEPGLKTFSARGMAQPLRLAMPYQYFVFDCKGGTELTTWSLTDYYLFWAKERISGWDGPVVAPRIPNVYDNGKICFGTTPTQAGGTPLHERIDLIINNFYQSDFTDHLQWRRPNEYRSYAAWATESRANQLCWREWTDWNDTQPLNQFLPRRQTADEIRVEGTIPEWVGGATFGRAAEWFRDLPPTDRYRLIEGIRNELPRVGLTVPVEINYEADDLAKLEAIVANEPTPRTPTARPEILPDEQNFGHTTNDNGDDWNEDEDEDENPICACNACRVPCNIDVDAFENWCENCLDGNHNLNPRE